MRQKPLASVAAALGLFGLVFSACAPDGHGSRSGIVNTAGPTQMASAQRNANNPNAQSAATRNCSNTAPVASDVSTISGDLTQRENNGTRTQITSLPAGNYTLTEFATSYSTPQNSPTYMTLQDDSVQMNDQNTPAGKASATYNCGLDLMAGETPAAPTTNTTNTTSPQMRSTSLQPAVQNPQTAAAQPQQQQKIQPDLMGRRFTMESKFTVASTNGSSTIQKTPIATIDILNQIGTGQSPVTALMNPSAPQGLLSEIDPTNFDGKGYQVVNSTSGMTSNEVFMSLSSDNKELFVYFTFYDTQVNAVRNYFFNYSITPAGTTATAPTAPTPAPSPVAPAATSPATVTNTNN